MSTLDNMLCAYIQTALWSSCDESDDAGGKPMDATYTYDDISPTLLEKMRSDCAKFLKLSEELLTLENFKGRTDYGSVTERAAHDFWLTRNHHGAGFWDGDWKEPAATKLSKIANSFSDMDLYVGDDGLIYC